MMKLCLLALPLGGAADLPATMRAAALTKRPWDLKVHIEDFAEVQARTPPSPKRGEVLVKVAGASVNPCEWKEIESPRVLSWSYPHVGGIDFAGTVLAVGHGVTRWKAGDNVWGMSGSEGAHAEYMVTDQQLVALAPTQIPLEEAAVLPLVSLTNLMGFRVAQGLWPLEGKVVVVLGGSGGTGHNAIQLAKAWGASKVVATCGTSNVEFCREMGADVVVDYRKANWTDVLGAGSVDFVYDTVSADRTGNLAYSVLRDGGCYVCLLGGCLAEDSVARERPSITQKSIFLGSAGYGSQDLDVVKGLVDSGKMRPHIQKVFTLSEVGQLFSTIMAGHSVGKNSMVPTGSSSALV